jgi:hypothetical protein
VARADRLGGGISSELSELNEEASSSVSFCCLTFFCCFAFFVRGGFAELSEELLPDDSLSESNATGKRGVLSLV